MDKELEIAARYVLTSSGHERFVADRALDIAEWVWLFEALLHAGCDVTDRWASFNQRTASHPQRQGLLPLELYTLEDQLKRCQVHDSITGEGWEAGHLEMIYSIKRELAKL